MSTAFSLQAQDFRVLHYTQTTGFNHGTADESLQMFQDLGVIHNFVVDHDNDGTAFNSLANLQTYDVIVWSNTSGSFNLNDTQKQNFEAYIHGGGSYVGIHAASDTYRHSTSNGANTGEWDFYSDICGGSVQTNPNHTAQGFTANINHVGVHASTVNLPDPWNKDEEYYYWENGYLHPEIVEVLSVEATGAQSYDVARPVSWYRKLPWGGRSFYTALGHSPANFVVDVNFRNHIRDALLWAVQDDVPSVSIQGELKKWHKIDLVLDGPTSSENDPSNPFSDFRMLVSFSQGNKTITVPGYFAADGNAAESSASSGNKWIAHFRPETEGIWNYSISFRYGTDVAISNDPDAGTATIYDGLSGSINVGPNDKTGDDFRAKGRLKYVGEHYFGFEDSGELFIKGGTNSPENFLGYFEFDNTYDNGGNGNALHTNDLFVSQGNTYTYYNDGLHHYEPHMGDWQNGDPSWQNGKGQGIIGAVNYLASEKVNFLYCLSMNVEGDGREVFPWTEYWERDKYDISKLAQWEIVFDHMEAKGIGIQLVLQEQENDQLLDAGHLGRHRRLYFRELIARFGHHLGIVWNLGEENTNTKIQRLEFAEFFEQFDPYANPVAVHTFIGQQQDIYGDIVGLPNFDVASVQMDLKDIPKEVKKWVEQSAANGRKWVVASDEIGPFDVGVSPDGAGNNHLDIRNHALYGTLFNGGGGTEWYFGYDVDHNDLDCEDFRSRDTIWNYTRYAREFMQNYLTFPAMRPADSLTNNPDARCFALDSIAYAIYLPNPVSTDLNLGSFAGNLQVQWYNPRLGGALQNGDVLSITGPGLQNIGSPPAGSPGDWIALVGADTPFPLNTHPNFALSGDINVQENFATTETVTVSPEPVPPAEASQTVTYSLIPASVGFANVSIDPGTGNVTITAIADTFGSQVFTIQANDGQIYNNIATQTFTLIVQPQTPPVSSVYINTGGPAYTATNGDDFIADQYFSSGSVYTTTANITNTLDPTIYQTERTNTGPLIYSIPVGNGEYTVRLHFAEIFHNQAGNRLMDISIEGNTVLTNFDVFAEAGGNNTALIRDFAATVSDGIMDISFVASIDQPKISAIQLIPANIGPNTPPTFTINNDSLVANEDFAGTIGLTVTPDPVVPAEAWQTVSYSLIPATVPFANIVIDPLTGAVSITAIPDAYGSQQFTITADDGQSTNNTATQAFWLTVDAVNDAPDFSLSGDLNLIEDFTGTQSVTVNPAAVPFGETSQVVSYSLNPASVDFATVSIDPVTGEVSVDAIQDSTGTQVFTVTADDGEPSNNLATATFTLIVSPLNDPPTFVVNGNITENEDFAGIVNLTITPDPLSPEEAGQIPTYSLNPASVNFANISIDPLTGEVSVSSIQNETGSEVIEIIADDGQSNNNLASQSFTLTILPVNDPPIFTTSGDLTVLEDFVGTNTISVFPELPPIDEQAQIPTYSLAPATVSFANIGFNPLTGEVSVSSVPNAVGSQLFTITADDGQLANNLASQSFTLTVAPENDPPTFITSGDLFLSESFPGTETVTITPNPVHLDEQGQNVVYSLSPASIPFANVSIDPVTGTVSVTSIPGFYGSQIFFITADDGQSDNNQASQPFSLIIVQTDNSPPSFTLSGDINVDEDFLTTETVVLTPDPVPADEMEQTVSYTIAPTSVPFANISFDPNTGNVSVTAIADEFGNQTFTITANDGAALNPTFSSTFDLNVNPVNDPPLFSNSGGIFVSEDFTTTETVTVVPGTVPANETDQLVTYSLTPASIPFADVVIDPNTGQVDITSVADGVGTQQFTITADDGQALNNLATSTFTLIVGPENDPPAFTTSGDLMVDENFAGTQTVTVTPDPVSADEAGQTVTYSLSPASISFANVSIDPATGEVSFTSVPNFFGSQTFTITADDGQFSNNLFSQTFTFTVNQTDNTPPTFTLSGDIVVDEDFVTTEQVIVSPDPVPLDEQGENVTYSISPTTVSFANINFDPLSGNVNITFVPDANGSQLFTITANDGSVINPTATASFVLTVNPINDAPVFGHSGDANVNEDFVGPVFVNVTAATPPADEAAQTIVYSLDPPTVPFADISIDPVSGQVRIDPVADGAGSQTFSIIANDGQAENNIFTSDFVLNVVPENDPPVFSISGDISVLEDFTTTEIVSITPGPVPPDEASQQVIYSLSPSSIPFANVVIDSLTGEVTITSVPDGAGSQVFTITANDGGGGNATYSQDFILNVSPSNDAPTFQMSRDVNELEDFTGTIIVDAVPDPVGIDEQGQVVTYSISPPTIGFANVQFDPATGQVSIQSIPNASGSQVFTITADDGQIINNTATASFTLTVSPVDDPPNFTLNGDLILEEDFVGPVSYTIAEGNVPADEIGQTISYTLNPSTIAFADMSFDPSNGSISFMPIADANGSQLLTITASDGNSTVDQSFTFTVNPVNDKPVFTVSGDLDLVEDFPGTEEVSASLVAPPLDEVDQTLTYTIEPASVDFINVNLDPGTGLVSFTAVPNATGSQRFTLYVSDGGAVNDTASQSFSVTVTAEDDPPSFTLNTNLIEEEEDFAEPDTIFLLPDPVPDDEQSQTVNYQLLPESLSFVDLDFNPITGWLIVNAIPDSNGTATLSITADDGTAPNRFYTEEIVIQINAVNDPPSFHLNRDSVLVAPNFASEEVLIAQADTVPLDERDQQVRYGLQPASVPFANVQIDSLTGEVRITAVQDAFGSQLFMVVADDGQAVNATAVDSFYLEVATPVPTSLRINAGSNMDMAFGTYVFLADTFYTGGTPSYNARITDVLQTSWDELYRSGRVGDSSSSSIYYNIPLTDGEYVVFLHFAEMKYGAFGGECCGEVGKRTFAITSEGSQIFESFDILSQVGPMTALFKSFPVSVNGGELNLVLDAISDQPAIQAIEILTPEEAENTIVNTENPNQTLVDPLFDFSQRDTNNVGNILIYPNPTKDNLNLIMENGLQGSIEMHVFDNFGRKYKSFQLEKPGTWATFTLPVDDLTPGFYVLQIVGEGLTYARKFWKQE